MPTDPIPDDDSAIIAAIDAEVTARMNAVTALAALSASADTAAFTTSSDGIVAAVTALSSKLTTLNTSLNSLFSKTTATFTNVTVTVTGSIALGTQLKALAEANTPVQSVSPHGAILTTDFDTLQSWDIVYRTQTTTTRTINVVDAILDLGALYEYWSITGAIGAEPVTKKQISKFEDNLIARGLKPTVDTKHLAYRDISGTIDNTQLDILKTPDTPST